jgi:hypothetical protein
MKMREAPWSAAAELPPWNPNQKAVAGATALQGAFGTTIFKAAKHLSSCLFSIICEQLQGCFAEFTLSAAHGLSMTGFKFLTASYALG